MSYQEKEELQQEAIKFQYGCMQITRRKWVVIERDLSVFVHSSTSPYELFCLPIYKTISKKINAIQAKILTQKLISNEPLLPDEELWLLPDGGSFL